MQPGWLPPREESTGMVVCVVDIETTGTDPTVHAIIEIASVDVLADGTIANRQSTPGQARHPDPARGERGASPHRRGPRRHAAAYERHPPLQGRRRLRGAQLRVRTRLLGPRRGDEGLHVQVRA